MEKTVTRSVGKASYQCFEEVSYQRLHHSGLRLFQPQLKASRSRIQRATSRLETRLCLIKWTKDWFPGKTGVFELKSEPKTFLSHLHVQPGDERLEKKLRIWSSVLEWELRHSEAIRSRATSKNQCDARSFKAVVRKICIRHRPSGWWIWEASTLLS